jgi:hypothetical protein
MKKIMIKLTQAKKIYDKTLIFFELDWGIGELFPHNSHMPQSPYQVIV